MLTWLKRVIDFRSHAKGHTILCDVYYQPANDWSDERFSKSKSLLCDEFSIFWPPDWSKGRTIRKLMGGGRAKNKKNIRARHNWMKKNSCTPIKVLLWSNQASFVFFVFYNVWKLINTHTKFETVIPTGSPTFWAMFFSGGRPPLPKQEMAQRKGGIGSRSSVTSSYPLN